MSTQPEPDATTNADYELLERASEAELAPAALEQADGATEHPSGQAAAADAEEHRGYAGSAVRRQPRSE